jgi:ATP-dependent exoDNAse (exonuclease V) alpha subunit
MIFETFPGDEHVYSSRDSVEQGDNEHQYPMEYLNSISLGTLPQSQLHLKVGVPLILLRNINPEQGLCNGTRLRLVHMSSRVLRVRIITGPAKGQLAFIPRIRLTTTDTQLPFQLLRVQFPVRLAFAMTINKSQGQSLGYVGLDLRSPVFSHGQFYVGVSRGKNWSNVKVLLDKDKADKKTQNIVYPEVLLK